MVDNQNTPGVGADKQKLMELATKPESRKPDDVRDAAWRRARMEAGHMVLIRSHFKSIYLVPMTIISLICGILVSMGPAGVDGAWAHSLGLIWAVCFMFYMNIFIFEWNRAWTLVLIFGMITVSALGFAVNSEAFPVWHHIGSLFKNLRLGLTPQLYFFFAIFFGSCAAVSWIKTRMNYVVIEHNEMQIYRNAFFGDRERISMLSPRIEVKVPDMIEYFHPFYRAGTVVIHAPSKTIILENVLGIRKVERITDRLGSTLSVRVERENEGGGEEI